MKKKREYSHNKNFYDISVVLWRLNKIEVES